MSLCLPGTTLVQIHTGGKLTVNLLIVGCLIQAGFLAFLINRAIRNNPPQGSMIVDTAMHDIPCMT